MEKMTLIMDNWYIFIGIGAVAVVAGLAVGKFLTLPTSTQIEKAKEWMLWAVTQAEAELGGGTGQLKLRLVYDMFIERFPAIAKAVSFDTFMSWVDEALEDMREMLKQNEAVQELVGVEHHG